MTNTSNPSPLQLFVNPWKMPGTKFNKETQARFQVDMPKEEYNFFKSINPIAGVLQTTTNILLKKLQYELRQQGITTVTQCREFCEAVAGSKIILGGRELSLAGSPASGTLPEAGSSNDRRGKKTPPRKNKKP